MKLNKIKQWIKTNGEYTLYVFVTVVTILCGILSEIVNKESFAFTIVSVGFYGGLSFDMLLIMWQFPKMKDAIFEMHKYVKQEECIHFDASADRSEVKKLFDLIKLHNEGSFYIFCYGTNLFGNVIRDIMQYNTDYQKKYEINLVICNPDSEIISKRNNDKEKLITNIFDCIENKRHFKSLLVIDVPKTYRACVFKTNQKPVWASFQSYIFSNKTFFSTQNSRTPIISAGIENGDILTSLENLLDKEWCDILLHCNPTKIILDGEITDEGKEFVNEHK